MPTPHQDSLEKLGLSSSEAQIYLTLLRNGRAMGASTVAADTGMARSSVYPALSRLTDLGLVEAEAGYGSGFSAVPPERALPSLMVREMEELSNRRRLARELIGQLESVAEPRENNAESELIQVLRDPRVIAERFDRLQVEAEREIQGFVKGPILNPRPANPAQKKARRHGVRIRAIYERSVIEHPSVKPYLAEWLGGGEEARVYAGELPHKLQIFDQKVVLLPLIMPGAQMRALFIRHPQLALSLSMLFESLWQQSEPLTVEAAKRAGNLAETSASNGRNKNSALRLGTAKQAPKT